MLNTEFFWLYQFLHLGTSPTIKLPLSAGREYDFGKAIMPARENYSCNFDSRFFRPTPSAFVGLKQHNAR